MGNTITTGVAYKDQDIQAATTVNAVTIQPTFSLAHGTGTAPTLGFYGITAIVQRTYTSAVHLSSETATSTPFGATQLAAVNEIQKTMVALGIWATS